MREAFDLLDADGTGTIDVRDLKASGASPGGEGGGLPLRFPFSPPPPAQVSIRALGFDPTKEELRRVVAEVDKEGAGKIGFDAFYSVMTQKMVGPPARSPRGRGGQPQPPTPRSGELGRILRLLKREASGRKPLAERGRGRGEPWGGQLCGARETSSPPPIP